MKQTMYIMVWTLAVLLATTGCRRQQQLRRTTGVTWGTEYHITYVADRDLADSIVAVMDGIDRSLSPFREGSIISMVNAGDDVEVDSMWRDVMTLSQRVCRLSGGAFDPTVAPLVNLWGFGYRGHDVPEPTREQIDSALQYVGILECSIDAAGRVHKKASATEFNFSAVAKGYGVDCIARMLRRNGCTDYMVEVGGEIALSGNGPSGNGWRIQVDAPIEDYGVTEHNRLSVLNVTDCGIATSGNYRNYRDTGSGRVGHTISPITGMPYRSEVLSATVIAPTCAEADALATAMMAQPPQTAMDMIGNCRGVSAMIVTLAPDSTLQVHTTTGFPAAR